MPRTATADGVGANSDATTVDRVVAVLEEEGHPTEMALSMEKNETAPLLQGEARNLNKTIAIGALI
jgi:CO dehydrogenase/acetyl-CoA synthase beta subunit